MHAKKETPLKTKKSILSILFGLVGLAFLLIGCGQTAGTEATTEVGNPAETASPTEVVPVAEQTAPVDYCIECHSDKDQLIDTAAPEQEVISENEGEG